MPLPPPNWKSITWHHISTKYMLVEFHFHKKTNLIIQLILCHFYIWKIQESQTTINLNHCKNLLSFFLQYQNLLSWDQILETII